MLVSKQCTHLRSEPGDILVTHARRVEESVVIWGEVWVTEQLSLPQLGQQLFHLSLGLKASGVYRLGQ